MTERESVKTELSQSCVSTRLSNGDDSIKKHTASTSVLPDDAIACLQMARLQQDKIIARKKRTSVRPCAGKLMTLKKNIPAEERLKLSDIMGSRVLERAARSRKVEVMCPDPKDSTFEQHVPYN